MDATALAPLCLAVPFLVTALLAATGRWLPRTLVDAASTATALAVAGLAAALLVEAGRGHVVTWSGGWEPHGGTSVGVVLVADRAGAGLALLSAVLAVAAFVYSWRYVAEVEVYFHALVLVFLGATCGLALTGDLFDMVVFLELTGVVAYALTAYQVDEPQTLQGALTFGVTNTLGASCTLLGVGLVYARTGELSLALIGERLALGPHDGLVTSAFVLVVTGFLVKAAAVPFHFWAADAHAVAPTAANVLLSGLLGGLGVYAVARLTWTAFAGSVTPEGVRRALLALGLLTVLVGGALSLMQSHLKRLLAFAAVGHVGVLLVAVALLDTTATAGAALYALGHAGVVAALFFATGVLLNRTGSVDEGDLHGRGRDMPVTGGVFLLGGLALAGAPPFALAPAKALVDEAARATGVGWVAWVLLVGAALTGGAVLRAGLHVFAGAGQSGDEPEDGGTVGGVRERDEEPETGTTPMTRVPARMLAPAVTLLAGSGAVALVPGMAGALGTAAATFTDPTGYAAATLGRPAPAPAHAPLHLWTTDATLTAVLGTLLALVVASVSVWHHRIPQPLRRPTARLAAVLGPAVSGVRRLHSGHIGDYAAWLLVGVALLGGLVATG